MATTAHFLVNTLALKRGGLVKAVRDRANALCADGRLQCVEIDILGAQSLLARDVAVLKSEGHLHKDVHVRSILYALDGSGPEMRVPVLTGEEEGVIAYEADDTGLAYRLFKGGLMERYVRFSLQGHPEIVDYFSAFRQRIRREEMDGDGRLMRVLDFQPGAQHPATQRYIGRDGKCFLTIWQGSLDGKWGASFIHEQGRTFKRMGLLYTYALDMLLQDEDAPAICSEFRENLTNFPHENIDDVLRGLRHPHVRKIAVAHSNHFNAPYVRGAGRSRNWSRLLENVDELDAVVTLTQAQGRDLAAATTGHATFQVAGHAAPPVAAPTDVDSNRVVMVARTHPKKRVDEAIRAFSVIQSAVSTARLEIFGFGYGDEEEQKIRALVTEFGLVRHVDFKPFTADVSEIYDGACLTLFTSASEGYGMVLLESMSHGVPVVAYDINYGPREVIVDGQNGFLLPFGDHAELALRSLEIMGDPQLRRRMSRECQTTAGKFSRSGFVENWLDILEPAPRPDRIRGATIGPVVEAITFADNIATLRKSTGLRSGISLLLKERGSDIDHHCLSEDAEAWTIELPRVSKGSVVDVYADAGGGLRKRVQAGDLAEQTEGGWRAYSSSSGSLSIKRVGGGR